MNRIDTDGQLALLEVRGLEVVYHHVITAVQGVSLRVMPGTVTALLGVNGAGKTSTLRAISGFIGADNAKIVSGEIRFRGQPITGWEPVQTYRLGIALVPERRKVFSTLTVAENLAVAGIPPRSERAEEIYELFPPLRSLQSRLAGYLSGGERQMLAIATALAGSPQLLLIDEPSLGLAPKVAQAVLQTLPRLVRERKLSVLLVEQNASLALEVADYGYVVESGRVVFDGPPEKLKAHQDVAEFYLGAQTDGVRSYRDVRQYRRKRRWWG